MGFVTVPVTMHHGRWFDAAAVVRVLTQRKAVKHHAPQGGYLKKRVIFLGKVKMGFVMVRKD